MFFIRKKQKNVNATFITIPKPVADAWNNVNKLDMIFDAKHNTIVITPRK